MARQQYDERKPRAFPSTAIEAFPSTAIEDRYGGMTLHEHYAGLAMAAEIASAGANEEAAAALADAATEHGMGIEERIAFNAFAIADAMMAERARRAWEVEE